MGFCTDKRIRRLGFYLALFFLVKFSFAQQAYFQQEVNYTIKVKLNDVNHSLSASERVQYINNSTSTLTFIYFHLWPNAYKNNSTALARQLLREGKTDFYFSDKDERGFIDSLNFKVNDITLRWEFDTEHMDICKVFLDKPLKPYDTVSITTPFYVKIPDARFSRLGHAGQAYFITQWFPQPAVFDREGWHAMPYLDQGEFFSEFGSFDVKITLPKNYLLAATGDRVDADEEEDFLNEQVKLTLTHLDNNTRKPNGMAFPESSKEFKTVHFKQYNVHDFAWFSDKRFYVLHDQVQLPVSKRTVDTWAFFTDKNFDLWKESISYINDATLFYSHLLGDYPYKHVTAIDGTIMAGGGMEYPNITVIGDMDDAFDLDITLAHEVGHNWFYGVLANNERDNPGLDEGINSFYEMRYSRAKYPKEKLSRYLGRDTTFKIIGLNKLPSWKEKELAYYMAKRLNIDQPINLTSNEFTAFNYGSIIYGKTALVMDYLMEYLGEVNFDEAMKFYYNQFKYKHPTTKDLLKTLGFYGGVNLDNFENTFFNSTAAIDYKISNVKRNTDGTYELKLKNKTGVNTPFNLYAYKDKKPIGLIWFDGFDKTRNVTFANKDVDYFKIDGNDKLQDVNRRNNIIKTKGLFKKLKPLKISMVMHVEDPMKTQVNWSPLFGANLYNGFMIGSAFHNYGLFKKKFEYYLAPMFATKTKSPVGFAELNYNIFPRKTFQQITLGLKAKSFTYDYYNTDFINQNFGTNYKNIYLNYFKIAPSIEFELKKKKPTSPVSQTLSYANINLFTDSLDQHSFAKLTVKGSPSPKKGIYSFVNQVNYNLNNRRSIQPFHLNLNLQHSASMAKASLTFNYRIKTSPRNDVEFRFFAGTFITGSETEKRYYAFRASGYNGYYDYAFEGNYFGRNEFTGFSFSQFMEKDGALKVWTPLGQTSHWMSSVNIKSPKFFVLPVKLFADIVACDGRALINDKVLWDAGINFTVWRDVVEVYVPLAYSNDIKTTLDLNNINFFQRIRFTFNIHKLEPKNIIKNNLPL